MVRTFLIAGLTVGLLASVGLKAQNRPVTKLALEQFFDMDGVKPPDLS